MCGKENDSNKSRELRAKKRRHLPDRDEHTSLYRPVILQPPTKHSGEGKEEGGRVREEGGGVREEGGGVRELDHRKLVAILKAYGEYPDKYRAFIWRSLLQLPGNHTSYSSLLERGTHSAYTNLHRVYPIRSQRLSRVLQRWADRIFLPLSSIFPFNFTPVFSQISLSIGTLVSDICRDPLPTWSGIPLCKDVS